MHITPISIAHMIHSFQNTLHDILQQTWCRNVCLSIIGCGTILLYSKSFIPFVSHNIIIIGIIIYLFGSIHSIFHIIESFLNKKINVDFLMMLSAYGAAFLGNWAEGAALLFLFSLSEALLHKANNKATIAINAIMELRPDTARIVNADNSNTIMKLEDVLVGDIIAIHPGDRIPLDGTIIKGATSIDESSITGESIPIDKSINDAAISGTLNLSGYIEICVSTIMQESSIARIINMVHNAQKNKARVQNFIEKSEKWYVLGVLISIVFYINIAIFMNIPSYTVWYNALVLLTVLAPCALVLSIPVCMLCSIAKASRMGILFKGGNSLSHLASVQAIAFDKTGTLTHANITVSTVETWDNDFTEIMTIITSVEQYSEHPFAHAITHYASQHNIQTKEITHFSTIHGKGVTALYNNMEVIIGSQLFLQENNISISEKQSQYIMNIQQQGGILMLAYAHKLQAIILLEDHIRSEAPSVITHISNMLKIPYLCIISGDGIKNTQHIAQKTNITHVHAELLPKEKLEIITRLKQKYKMVAMLGDGINDAPALANASIGIAMGLQGTEVALETADAILMSNDLTSLAHAIELARANNRIIYQNVIFSLSVIITLAIFTLFNQVNIITGLIGHEGSTIIVVLNGLRLLSFKPKKIKK